jgi:hypothetical protein
MTMTLPFGKNCVGMRGVARIRLSTLRLRRHPADADRLASEDQASSSRTGRSEWTDSDHPETLQRWMLAEVYIDSLTTVTERQVSCA